MGSAELPTVRDTLDRPVRDLRISVTDRCNFRCIYCMPREVFGPGYAFVPRDDLLRLEEIARLTRVFASLGVCKVRITGGEPMIRRNLEYLIEAVSAIAGIDDISMTTNASLLTRRRAESLREAGLKRLTVSLDALDEETFRQVNDVDFPVASVLKGIDNAQAAGYESIKVNAVIKRGLNDHSILPLARYFQGTGLILRFIEFMDVGSTNNWKLDEVIPATEMVAMIDQEMAIEPLSPNYQGEVAKRWRYVDGSGEVGFITSVTESFCGECTRARLTAIGQVYTCLFAAKGHDLRSPLRAGASDEALTEIITSLWGTREDRYSELRGQVPVDVLAAPRVEMSHIGG
ncbi:MAG: GTP 3',8-cyclase MoaA [Arenicellales bacterium]|nr:GTP 3',8-cyclase MoaA [Acidiferrobacteraceae bacterium]MDP6137036.1 GTP 3',8-cyclase MoaA [Arenicellales bacterium]HCF74219.1 GTP 3',8-cyclase MoaA [Gammaproteobacteria bacterium]MDP6391720.1 GTP 3',8-cyclase MoaA [Arenicellales bacterium]MDP7220014.1 GTP 3',8-cyclase MoaA [Arenicellales bacterium]|tara:strand:+ start:72063 stop:73100 length:1038 start_codon:yes stop_codon:yes gene_type:complete